jgi:LysM repeat protein
MTAIRILTPSLLAAALVSCASKNSSDYDTSNPYGTPASDAANPAPPAATAPANPVYDTPAAYEESTPENPGKPADPALTNVPAAPAHGVNPPAHGPAVIHTVVAGDTLSGISSKYKIPAASIKQANRMTNDTVVLGRKMVIPPR